MSNIFYFIGMLYLLYEICYISNIKSSVENRRRSYQLHNKFKDTPFKSWPEEYKFVVYKSFFILLPLFIWTLLGLFTHQWYLVLC